MEDGDTEKYHARSLNQDFVFLSRKGGCIRCISLQVYNKSCYLLIIHSAADYHSETENVLTSRGWVGWICKEKKKMLSKSHKHLQKPI